MGAEKEQLWACWGTNDQGKHTAIWSSCPAVFSRIPALPIAKDKCANEASEILLLV